MFGGSTDKYTKPASHYAKYRPDYPMQVILHLQKEGLLDKDFVVADVGSGTGKSSVLFLPHVKQVIGIEPNDKMRELSEGLVGKNFGFSTIKATAEDTTLADASADLVLVGHAFHWFDSKQAKLEFSRILKKERPVVLVWNKRHHDASNFMLAYNDFIAKFSLKDWPNYYENWDANVFNKFYDFGWYQATFRNEQEMDWEGLKGFYLSAAYAFSEEHPEHRQAIQALFELFERFQHNGIVKFVYKTEMIYGLFNRKEFALWKKTVFHLLRIPAFFMYGFIQFGLFTKSMFKKLVSKLK